MKKSDMLTLNNRSLSYSYMGLFDTDKIWIHPTVTLDTYELLFVTAGVVHIREGERRYSLQPGELLILSPGIEHGGFLHSEGHTSFYWLHFYSDAGERWNLPKLCTPDGNTERTLRELLHFGACDTELVELALATFLLRLRENENSGNKTAQEADEYIRIHARSPLTVSAVAKQLGYATDHLSRIYKKQFGVSCKEGIVRHRLDYIKTLLTTSNDSIKEIAASCGFGDDNHFVKFFKYHEKTTPTAYRNRFFHIHMNDR